MRHSAPRGRRAVDIDVEQRPRRPVKKANKLRQIFETVPSQLWSADAAGELTYFNQRLLDYSGMRFEDFKHGG